MKSLNDVLSHDARVSLDSKLTPEQYRHVLEMAAPVFREGSLREAFPVTIMNDPGVLKSRHIAVVDVGDVDHGMNGTGGQFDKVDSSTVDEVAYAIWKNIQVPWRLGEASARGGFDILGESGVAAGEKVGEAENTMLVSGLGPVTGLTARSGIQTFTGATWATAGNAFVDINKAINDLMVEKKVPRNAPKALLVHPDQYAELWHSDLTKKDMRELRELLPGGIFPSADVTAGKAYVYAKTPTVVEYRVYQDLSVVPLPKLDEDERMRARVIGALHVKKLDGVVEITGI